MTLSPRRGCFDGVMGRYFGDLAGFAAMPLRTMMINFTAPRCQCVSFDDIFDDAFY